MAKHDVESRKARVSASCKAVARVLFMLGGAASINSAQAGQTFDLGDGHSFTIGTGVRASISPLSFDAPGGYGDAASSQFSLVDFRIYTTVKWNDYLAATISSERAAGDGPIQILDAYPQFEPMNEVNVWIGQSLPPSDRLNLDGPFYLGEYLYPFVSQYPGRFAGRDLGGVIWGKLFHKKVVYAAGIFAGHNLGTTRQPGDPFAPVGSPAFPNLWLWNQSHALLLAARLAYNFWGPEPAPACYTGGTHYRKADILTIAAAGMFQQDGERRRALSGTYIA